MHRKIIVLSLIFVSIVMFTSSAWAATPAHDPIYFSTLHGVYRHDLSGTSLVYTPSVDWFPVDVAKDSQGNVYVALFCEGPACNYQGGQLLKNGAPIFSSPTRRVVHVEVDIHDNVYYSTLDKIQKIDASGIKSTIYTAPMEWLIEAVAADSGGNIYASIICENQLSCPSTIRSQLIKNGVPVFTTLDGIEMTDISVDIRDGVYYSANDKVFRYTGGSSLVYSAPMGWGISGIGVDSGQNIYVAEGCDFTACSAIQGTLVKVTSTGQTIIQTTQGDYFMSVDVQPTLPVLLVHGVYADDTIWNQFEQSYPGQVFRVGKVLGQRGLVPNNGDIALLVKQEKLALDKLENQYGYKKFDVVAHSMGGLVTRSYIASNLYKNNIRKLIMLGTPNEGADIANSWIAQIFGHLQGGDPFNTALAQMAVNSPFITKLNQKNNNANTRKVQYYAISGTWLTTNFLQPLVCAAVPTFCNGTVSDSIVAMSSVNFIGSCYQDDVAHTTILGPAYYTAPSTIQAVISLLEESTASLAGCPIP